MLPAPPTALWCRCWPRPLTASLAALLVNIWLTKPAAARVMLDNSLTYPLSEVSWSPERSGVFLGTPSLLMLHNGSLLASYDQFGPGEWARNATIHVSDDGGTTWRYRSQAPQQYWSNLFLHNGEVYILGTTRDTNAGVAISRSIDEGRTWEQQVLWGWPGSGVGSYATGATPVVEAHGRLWRCMELWHNPRRWPQDFQAVVLSVGVDEDLLNPLAWTMSEALPYNTSWLPPDLNATSAPVSGFLEGNMVVGPEGEVQVLMRTSMQNLRQQYLDLNHATLLTFQPSPNPAPPQTYSEHRLFPPAPPSAAPAPSAPGSKVVWMHEATGAESDSDGVAPAPLPDGGPVSRPRSIQSASQPRGRGRRLRAAALDAPLSGTGSLAYTATVAMPGGGNKFVVRYDNETRMYVSFTNPGTAKYAGYDQRNILVLSISPDLRAWRQIHVILTDDSGFTWIDSLRYTGFHYVDWLFDGAHLIGLVRTAYRGANSYHNSNRITFLRVTAWRQYLEDATSTSQELASLVKQAACNTTLFMDGDAPVTDGDPQFASNPCEIPPPDHEAKVAANNGNFYWGSQCCSGAGAICSASCGSEFSDVIAAVVQQQGAMAPNMSLLVG